MDRMLHFEKKQVRNCRTVDEVRLRTWGFESIDIRHRWVSKGVQSHI